MKVGEDTQLVLNDVFAERKRQERLWGQEDGLYANDATAMGVIGEEYGEACEEVNENEMNILQTGFNRDGHDERLYKELIQTAATACATAERIRRGRFYR